jgi:CubicO group peptidase (beta-lactamase class C family)
MGLRPLPFVRQAILCTALSAGLPGATGSQDPDLPRLTFGQAGIDSARVARLIERIQEGTFPGIDGLVIVRHGGLVAEAYFNGYGPDRPHDTRSATKSVTSILVGIAVEHGRLSLDTTIVSFFPEYRPAQGWDPAHAAIRLRDLLTMRTGLACDDFEEDSPGNEERMYPEPDWTRFFFRIPPGASPPGARFSYCTAGVAVLGEVLARAVGQSVSSFAEAVLWRPLGIHDARWRPTPTGGTMTGGNLELTPRDMAKLGQLYLRRGEYGGRRVLPRAWVERSCHAEVNEPDSGYHYGLLWWVENPLTASTAIPSCHASGNGGQKIFVFPSADLVVVFTGSSYNVARLSHRQPVAILNQYILPALN